MKIDRIDFLINNLKKKFTCLIIKCILFKQKHCICFKHTCCLSEIRFSHRNLAFPPKRQIDLTGCAEQCEPSNFFLFRHENFRNNV